MVARRTVKAFSVREDIEVVVALKNHIGGWLLRMQHRSSARQQRPDRYRVPRQILHGSTSE